MDSTLISIPTTTTTPITTTSTLEADTLHATQTTGPTKIPNPTDPTTTPPMPPPTTATPLVLVGSGRAQLLTPPKFSRPLRPRNWRVRRVARELWMREEERERVRVGMVGG